MSFIMTINITIDKFAPLKCNAAHWKRTMDEYCDYAKITLPTLCRLTKTGDQYDGKIVKTGLNFSEGMKVQIDCGYDGKNETRFKGFIKRINFTVPLEIECEGYSYQLNHKRVNKHYKNVKMKAILAELVQGTDIKLSKNIPDVLVEDAWFDNCTGLQVLEWFKHKMLQTVYFNMDELYVGLRYLSGYQKTAYQQEPLKVKHRLNWNVIKDNELLFEENKEGTKTIIHIQGAKKTGGYANVGNVKPSETNVKKMRIYGINISNEFVKKVQEDKQLINNYKGYTGKITAFLEPIVDLNMVSVISDSNYPSRNGIYVIEGIEGSFSRSGGRQKIHVGINV